MNSRKLIVFALALAGVLSVGLAQARDHNDVQWSVTIGAPIGVPLYSQPYPVYSQPVPVYAQPYPAYSQPYPVFAPRHYPQRQYQQPTRWDRDGDGIPNRYDRYDRDNPRDHAGRDRDGDGIPNWQDRYDGYPGRGR